MAAPRNLSMNRGTHRHAGQITRKQFGKGPPD